MSESSEQYHSASHCRYLTQYHIIWCPKFRYNVLQNDVDTAIKRILYEICDKYNYSIKALEVMPDHIHMLLEIQMQQDFIEHSIHMKCMKY